MALRRRGLTLASFTAGSAAGRRQAERWLDASAVVSLAEIIEAQPDLYFLCVPDSVIADIAAELGAALAAWNAAHPGRGTSPVADPAQLRAAAPVVAHTSGATSVSVLAPCETAGAAALVFHPLQTFAEPVTGALRFAGAGVAVTPGPARPDVAGTIGLKLADLLGLRPFFLDDSKRSLYHAAATVACNYLVTLEHVANELFVKAGVPERVTLELFLPLVQATLDNIAARGPVAALTGPLSRGDASTIGAHLEALATDAPGALSLYRSLGEATLELVAARHEVDVAVLARMKELLTGPVPTPDPTRSPFSSQATG